MAGDWVKMRVALSYDLKVVRIARMLEPVLCVTLQRDSCHARVTQLCVIGALFRFWSAAQEASEDGKLGSLTPEDVDSVAGIPGFYDALAAVGWVEIDETGSLQVHNWEAHNGEGAKRRLLASRRQQRRRAKDPAKSTEAVTPERDKSVTREEKRREEIKHAPPGDTPRPRRSTGTSRAPRATAREKAEGMALPWEELRERWVTWVRHLFAQTRKPTETQLQAHVAKLGQVGSPGAAGDLLEYLTGAGASGISPKALEIARERAKAVGVNGNGDVNNPEFRRFMDDFWARADRRG